jgi:hypothetical protein
VFLSIGTKIVVPRPRRVCRADLALASDVSVSELRVVGGGQDSPASGRDDCEKCEQWLRTRAETDQTWQPSYSRQDSGLRSDVIEFKGGRNCDEGQIALALAERGAQVIATDLSLPQETADKIGPAASAFQLDVTQEENWRSISQDVGEVDIVVNNAGYFPNRVIDELDFATWRKTIATNLDSHFLSAKYFLPTMRRKRWGRFVGISSNMVGLGMPRYLSMEISRTFPDSSRFVSGAPKFSSVLCFVYPDGAQVLLFEITASF